MASNYLLKRIYFALSALPLIWYFGVLLYYVRSGIYLGFWPNRHIADPKSLPFEIHQWFLMVLVYVIFSTLVVLPAIWILGYLSGKKIKNNIAIYLSGWGLTLVTMAMPGVNFVTWFLD